MNGKTFQRQYKERLSNYKEWDKKSHSEHYLIYPENLSTHLSLDETALSNGELYTILTNKFAKGKKGSIVAIIRGVKSEEIIELLKNNISSEARNKVQEITLDMASSMNLIAKKCFPKADRVTDRFHVQRLALEAVQELRIQHRWDAIKDEADKYKEAKEKGKIYKPETFDNDDTLKQLLARSRYLLFKHQSKWTESQTIRAEILFDLYPDIAETYNLVMELHDIFERNITPSIAITKLAHWFNKIEKTERKAFTVIKKTMEVHYKQISNYFKNRSTNASAESFNAKIKDFRRQFRGVTDVSYFLFRLTNIYA